MTTSEMNLTALTERDPTRPLWSGAGQVRAAWISSAEEFQELRTEWTALLERSCQQNAFLTFEWMHTWWNHWGRNRKLAIIAVRGPDGRLVALAPFYITRSFPSGLGALRLSFIADTYVGSDYLGIISEPGYEQAAVKEIARTLLRNHRRWDYIELRDCGDNPLSASFYECLREIGLTTYSTAASICYHIPLPESFDQYLATLSTGLRCNFRRRWKALQRDAQAELVRFSNVADIEQHFSELVRLHRTRFEHSGRQSAFLASGVQAFHEDAVRALANRGCARLLLLLANGRAVAALYALSIGKTFQFYQCGMDPDWLRSGVGQVLVGKAIEEAINTGHVDFDFLRGGESYKAHWAEQSRRTFTTRLFSHSPASVAARTMFRTMTAGRRVKRLLIQTAMTVSATLKHSNTPGQASSNE
jgi:CelD/BcsL family acetyltransferase involved in cellulose biosynthesis